MKRIKRKKIREICQDCTSVSVHYKNEPPESWECKAYLYHYCQDILETTMTKDFLSCKMKKIKPPPPLTRSDIWKKRFSLWGKRILNSWSEGNKDEGRTRKEIKK